MMGDISPIIPRNRSRPSVAPSSNYENTISTPIGKRNIAVVNTGSAERRLTRHSAIKHIKQLHLPSPGNVSPLSSNSNVENENTPRRKLSRNRRKPSFVAETLINEVERKVKCTIRRQMEDSVTEDVFSTPNTRNSTLRKSMRQSAKRASFYLDNTFSDDESPSNLKSTKRNASYFSKLDFDEFVPERDEESDIASESSEDDNVEDSSTEDSSEKEEDNLAQKTPTKRPLLGNDLSKLALTPEVRHKLGGHLVRRHFSVNSPVATTSQTMSPNPENYFCAETRIKFKKIDEKEAVMNDAMKGKRRRKKVREGVNNRLPEKMPSDFSVTAEANKATVSSENFISGNIHEDQVDRLFKNVVENEFPHWLGLFRDGFNVMLYGYGSKLSIFKEFEEFVNNHYLTVTINGLFPKLNPRKFLYGICEYIDPKLSIPHATNLEAVARDIVHLLKSANHPDVFILINNFDTMVLKFPQMLSVLCWLAQISYVHILASCDTVNAFLGVTQSQSLQLNFCWMHCPTYQSYRQECKWIPGIYGDETKAVTQKSSLKYVLQSLTGNARKAFALLSQMQLKQMKSRAVRAAKEAYAGVRFQELAKECREKFIAHSDENLRTLLVEFFDHKLIKQTGKGKHLENTLLIELDLETLEEIISELD